MRRIAVLSGLVLVGGLLGPAAAAADQRSDHGNAQHRWIAVQDQFTVVLPDGQTFTGNSIPNGQEPPPVGTQVFISEVLHETQDGTSQGKEVGRSHIECTTQAITANLLCDASLVFDTGSQLLISAVVDFSGTATSFDVAVTGGTGDWFAATGAVTITDISPSPDQSVSLYEADVVLPRD
jgi:hypothetical protein